MKRVAERLLALFALMGFVFWLGYAWSLGVRLVGWELADQYYDTAVQRLRDAEK